MVFAERLFCALLTIFLARGISGLVQAIFAYNDIVAIRVDIYSCALCLGLLLVALIDQPYNKNQKG